LIECIAMPLVAGEVVGQSDVAQISDQHIPS
jgi:hypothetical protein